MTRSMWMVDGRLLRRVKAAAPVRTVSENDGRRGGYYGGMDTATRSYNDVLIYVQKGLGDQKEALLGVAQTALAVQVGGCRRWNLYPMAFGQGPELYNERKFFEFGYTNDWMNDRKIAAVLSRISGTDAPTGQVVLPRMFPPRRQSGFAILKSHPDRSGLMILVCGPDGFLIDGRLRNRLPASMRRRVLVARIHEDSTDWELGKIGDGDFTEQDSNAAGLRPE